MKWQRGPDGGRPVAAEVTCEFAWLAAFVYKCVKIDYMLMIESNAWHQEVRKAEE